MRSVGLALLVALFLTLCVADSIDTRIQHRARTNMRFRQRRGRASSTVAGLPEPCYPPPCPGVGYDHSDSVSAAALKSLPGDTSVDNGGTNEMNVNGDNAGSPTPGLGPDMPSFTERPQGYVIMLPEPPIPLSNDDDLDPDCCNDGEGAPNTADAKTEAEDMKRVDKLNQKIEVKEISINQHDSWLDEAKKAMEKVQEHMKETQTSRDALANALEEIKVRKGEIENKYKVDRIKRKLDLAKRTLASLESESGGLRAAGNGLDAAQKNIEAKVSLLAEKLNIERDKVEEKAKEFDKANEKMTVVVKNFEEYSPDHIAY